MKSNILKSGFFNWLMIFVVIPIISVLTAFLFFGKSVDFEKYAYFFGFLFIIIYGIIILILNFLNKKEEKHVTFNEYLKSGLEQILSYKIFFIILLIGIIFLLILIVTRNVIFYGPIIITIPIAVAYCFWKDYGLKGLMLIIIIFIIIALLLFLFI